jgi:putative membrane protein insertion efficiency factor
VKIFILFLIRVYQLTLSPFLGKCCRFYPSCSDYGAEAIQKHGAWKGLFLALKRIGKCHPWHPGGTDLVP